METHLSELMRERGFKSYAEAHRWSVEQPEEFLRLTIKRLGIQFDQQPERILDLSNGIETPRWLAGAKFNIANCYRMRHMTDLSHAIRYRRRDGSIGHWYHVDLLAEAGCTAHGLRKLGLQPGDAVAIDMMMTPRSVAIYLGVLLFGGVVVSIADSFPAEEIAKRLRISAAKLVFTQDHLPRGDKTIPLYERVCAANAPRTVVIPLGEELTVKLRDGDLAYQDFDGRDSWYDAHIAEPTDPINILFSSGTTGDPKAIPWDQTTPIKCASDAYWHHDIREGDVVCWPTNLGWMMGPWLIFATLLNKGTIALYEGSPVERGFCEFVQDAEVTMLGLVPAIVRGWRKGNMTEGLDWSKLRCFSSTGEASSPDDYAWLMRQGQPEGLTKPIIEYCGGTEVGGGYISNILMEPCEPSVFNAKAMGCDFVVLDEQGHECKEGELGEVFLIPPSIGYSTRLLNRDHHEVYFAGCPTWNGKTLRRHGDRMRVLPGGKWSSDGRADNTMNLGGIKTSSAEIEAALRGVPGVLETAAVGVPPTTGGPDRLIVFAVMKEPNPNLATDCQKAISTKLNPLFRLHEVRVIENLPRTASNKVMHRELRDEYRQEDVRMVKVDP